MVMTIVLLLVGLAILTAGAEGLVRGASLFSKRLGVPSLIIGLTVVAYGTSAPEMAVSVKASFMGQSDLALGNVVGSNIFNILFILGVSALVAPLVVSRQLIRLDVPIMIAVTAALWWICSDGTISRMEGFLLIAGIVMYTLMQVWIGRRESKSTEGSDDRPPMSPTGILVDFLWIAAGLAALVYGAGLFNASAIEVARWMGVSELVIGLTIVAAGTSLPEVATSIMATIRGERDIAVGNVVGSNIFNILAVLGVSAAVSGTGVGVAASALSFDIPFALIVALACLPIFLSGTIISRVEAGIFLIGYVVYVTLLILSSTASPWLDDAQRTLLLVALPVALILIAVEFRRASSSAKHATVQ